MKESRYINLLSDFGFKRIFGKENSSEEFLIDFLNQLFKEDPELSGIVSIRYSNVEKSPTHKSGKGIRYDLICETDKGHKFIVEMQRRNKSNFTNRAIYYMCREIVEQGLQPGDRKEWNYEFLPVVGVFLTEFTLPNFKGRVVVKGKMIDPETGKTVLNQLMCAFVQLSAFQKKRDECKTGFDKWVYILKNMETLMEVPFTEYKNGIFERLGELSERANLSQEEMAEYNADLKWARDFNASIDYARAEGAKEGRAEGRAEGSREVARKLRDLGVDMATITQSTGLTEDEVRAL